MQTSLMLLGGLVDWYRHVFDGHLATQSQGIQRHFLRTDTGDSPELDGVSTSIEPAA